MAFEPMEMKKQLNAIAVAQKEISDTLTQIESRIEVLRQEFQRTSSAVYRLGIAQESAKNMSQRRENMLENLQLRLQEIERMLDNSE